MLTGRQNFCSY